MRKSILQIILVVCLGSLSAVAQDREVAELSEKLSSQILKSGKRSIAIASFSNVQNYGPQFGDYIVDQLGSLLAGSGQGFEVVTRSRLAQIMGERHLKFAESFDISAFQSLGKFAGADALVAGSYRVLGSAVSLNLQLLDVSKGTIIAGVIGSIPKTKDVEELLGGAQAPVHAPVSEERPSEPMPNRQPLNSGSAVSPLKASNRLTTEIQQFSFNLNSCNLRGDSVVCGMQITNQGVERELSIWVSLGRSRIIDPAGQEYLPLAALTRIGSKVGRNGVRVVGNLMPNGIPMTAEIGFAKIPPDVSSISLLEMGVTVGQSREALKIQFRGVPVTK